MIQILCCAPTRARRRANNLARLRGRGRETGLTLRVSKDPLFSPGPITLPIEHVLVV